MNSEDVIEREFKSGAILYLSAIVKLESLGYLPKDAEAKVNEWEEEMESTK